MATQDKTLANLSKRMKGVRGKVDHAKAYGIDDALKLVKETATAKFDESIDIAVNLGIDAKKSDQTVRGSVVLPAGTGKKVRVAVLHRVTRPKRPATLAPTSWASTTSPPRSRKASWTSTLPLRRRMR
jgi:large subunit ribosomal protein L1